MWLTRHRRAASTDVGMRKLPGFRMRAAFDMKSAQIGSAYRAPYPSGPMVAGLSNPTQTPATSDEEKPTNHASLKSFVVPVLPPAGKRTPSDRTGAPVPTSMTSDSIDTI